VTPSGPPEDAPARGDQHPARSGDRQGPQVQLLAQPDDPCPCTPQTCDWRCRACRVHGRPFYSHGDLQYLEHGTGPLAAELSRLRWVRVTGKRRTARKGGGHGVDGWQALPRGAAGLAPRCPPHGDGSAARASRTHVGGDRWSRPAPVGDLGARPPTGAASSPRGALHVEAWRCCAPVDPTQGALFDPRARRQRRRYSIPTSNGAAGPLERVSDVRPALVARSAHRQDLRP
jgi:hypothetical protein